MAELEAGANRGGRLEGVASKQYHTAHGLAM